MRFFLVLLPCVLAVAGGCYGVSSDADEEGGGTNAGGTNAGSGSGGRASGGKASGGRTSGTGGSSSAGSSSGGSVTGGSPGSAGEPATGGSAGALVCEVDGSTFPVIDRSCETEADCIPVHHTTDCCGSYLVMGINAGAEPAFAAAEMQC